MKTSNSKIQVGEVYYAGRNTFGMYIRLTNGTHVIPDHIFRECFDET